MGSSVVNRRLPLALPVFDEVYQRLGACTMLPRRFVFFLVLCAVFWVTGVWNYQIGDRGRWNEDDLGDLFMTISATNKCKIEIYWNLTRKVDEIRLYNFQGPFNESTPAKYTFTPKDQTAYFITNETFTLDKIPFEWQIESPGFNLTKGPINLDHCVSTIENNRITKTNCLKIQPTWMTDNGAKIGDIPLTELFIPGTHNSGCYGDDPYQDIKSPIFKFVYNQDIDLWNQLVFGIRYLDFRVGYYNTTFVRDSFWINHDKFRVSPLKDLFRDLKKFLARAKDEIVILDLHRFPVGFKNSTRHKQLTDLIDYELGDIAISRNYQKPPKGPTLNDLWEQKGRLIICYGDDNIASNSEYLWDPLTQKWGNKQKLEDLKQYLQEVRYAHDSKNSNKLWASMAELTATPSSIFEGLLNPKSHFKSIAHMADLVNRNLNIWYRHGKCDVNIIASDFFLGNDLINIAVECNLKNGK